MPIRAFPVGDVPREIIEARGPPSSYSSGFCLVYERAFISIRRSTFGDAAAGRPDLQWGFGGYARAVAIFDPSLWTPERVIAAWPRRRYLAALCSCPPGADSQGGRAAREWARWSILGTPAWVLKFGAEEADPIGRMCTEVEATAESARAERARLEAARPRQVGWSSVPFVGGWFVAIGYEAGRSVEPRAAMKHDRVDDAWPWSVVMWRVPHAMVFDHAEGAWWDVGGERRAERVENTDVVRRFGNLEFGGGDAHFAVSDLRPEEDRAAFEAQVARTVEYIRAGDIFQANIAHRLRGGFDGSTRALFGAMLRRSAPWYGAYLECADPTGFRAIASASPELFLQHHAPTRLTTTRPIKGTRSVGGSDGAKGLRESVKDQAELNMIVDLMRNDLGRVAKVGSVRVVEERVIERHGWAGEGRESVSPGSESRHTQSHASGPEGRPTQEPPTQGQGVYHGVATVRATLRKDAGLRELLMAAFPGGSITGAPKVRAMQVIEELEPRARGIYTGAIGYISDCGNVCLNIAIRTAVVRAPARAITPEPPNEPIDEIRGGELTYGAGAGIVADSVPALEWEETMQKAGVVTGIASCAESAAGHCGSRV